MARERAFGAWRRIGNRLLPAGERAPALWIAGAAAVLGGLRAFAYPSLQQSLASIVASPNADEFGFPLRATAVADVSWALAAGVLVWLLLRLAKAPRAVALYLVLAGVTVALVRMGDRLAVDAVMALAGSGYSRSLWSEMQPIMLALAEAVGVLLGAWAAQLMSGEERPADGSTFLPAIGWTGKPLAAAARLALWFAGARLVAQLTVTLLGFGTEVYPILVAASLPRNSASLSFLLAMISQAITVVTYFFVGYVGVKRFGSPRTIWLPFLAAGAQTAVAAMMFLPSQLTALAQSGQAVTIVAVLSGAPTLVAWPLAALSPIVGVWLATRPRRVSVSSVTLPAEDNDRW